MNDMARQWVADLKRRFPDVEMTSPAPSSCLDDAERALGGFPPQLRATLEVTNGLVCRSFRLYGVLDPAKPSKTWDSIERANDPAKTRALGGDAELLGRFLVIADIGNGFAMLDRNNGSIWFEENDEEEASQTGLSFRQFIEVMVDNAE